LLALWEQQFTERARPFPNLVSVRWFLGLQARAKREGKKEEGKYYGQHRQRPEQRKSGKKFGA
jgi:hypothetical protein